MLGQKTSAGYSLKGIRFAVFGACLCASPLLARGADWSVLYKNDSKFTLKDLFQPETNPGIAVDTSNTVDILLKTKTQLFRLSPGLTTRTDLFPPENFDPQYYPGITAAYSRNWKRTNFGASAYLNYSVANSSDFDEIREVILFKEEGTQLNYGGNASLSYQLTKRDSISWSAGYNKLEYSGIETLEPSESVSTDIGWDHRWSQLYTSHLTASLAYVKPGAYTSARNPLTGKPLIDPVTGEPIFRTILPVNRVETKTNFALDAKLTKRLSATGNIGLSFVDREGGGLSTSLVYGIVGSYALKNTTYTAGFSRTASVGRESRDQATYAFDLGAKHAVNDLTTVGISANYIYTPEVGPDTSGLFISPYINYQLAKDWDTTLTYQFSDTNEDGDNSIDNSVILKLSYGKTLLR